MRKSVCKSVYKRERERDLVKDVDVIHSSLNCLVYPGWFYHKIVFGLKNYVKNRVANHVWNHILDCNEKVDHHNPGTALILSNAGKLKIITNESQWASIICLQNVGLMLENTKFGYIISGKIPQSLSNNVKEVQMGATVP